MVKKLEKKREYRSGVDGQKFSHSDRQLVSRVELSVETYETVGRFQISLFTYRKQRNINSHD